MGVIRFAGVMAVIIVVACCLVAGLPDYPGRAYNTPDALKWDSFGDMGGAVILPAGWTGYDPFTTHLPYVGRTWFHESPSRTCRMMLAHSGSGRFEVFLTHGPADELDALIETVRRRYDDRDGARIETRTLKTADGVEVTLDVATIGNASPGEPLTYVLGFGAREDERFVLNAGGPTSSFDLADVTSLVSSLRLPHF